MPYEGRIRSIDIDWDGRLTEQGWRIDAGSANNVWNPNAICHPGHCDYCGGVDGMVDWDRGNVIDARDGKYSMPATFYRELPTPPFLMEHAAYSEWLRWVLYTVEEDKPFNLAKVSELWEPCPDCNRAGTVPAGYVAMDDDVVSKWLRTPCRCRAQSGRKG